MQIKSRLSAPTATSLPIVILLTLALGGQALAVTWSDPVPLTTSHDASAGGLATLGASTVIAVYQDEGAILTRRSTDSGATWGSALPLAVSGSEPAISARGTQVDVVWIHEGRVRYSRSGDSGVSFGSSVPLSPTTNAAVAPSVARGPNGRVAVIWHDSLNGRVRVRVSRNGGATFGTAKALAAASGAYVSPAIAVGKGVIYAAYFIDAVRLRLKRSMDSGMSWSSAVPVADNAQSWSGTGLAAARGQAYITYAGDDDNFWLRYRRTTDKGATWAPAADLSVWPSSATYDPVISIQGGVARAVFARCEDPDCLSVNVYYSQASDGTTWTAAAEVTPSESVFARPAGVGFAGRVVVLYTGSVDGTLGLDAYVRSGTP